MKLKLKFVKIGAMPMLKRLAFALCAADLIRALYNYLYNLHIVVSSLDVCPYETCACTHGTKEIRVYNKNKDKNDFDDTFGAVA